MTNLPTMSILILKDPIYVIFQIRNMASHKLTVQPPKIMDRPYKPTIFCGPGPADMWPSVNEALNRQLICNMCDEFFNVSSFLSIILFFFSPISHIIITSVKVRLFENFSLFFQFRACLNNCFTEMEKKNVLASYIPLSGFVVIFFPSTNFPLSD